MLQKAWRSDTALAAALGPLSLHRRQRKRWQQEAAEAGASRQRHGLPPSLTRQEPGPAPAFLPPHIADSSYQTPAQPVACVRVGRAGSPPVNCSLTRLRSFTQGFGLGDALPIWWCAGTFPAAPREGAGRLLPQLCSTSPWQAGEPAWKASPAGFISARSTIVL